MTHVDASGVQSLLQATNSDPALRKSPVVHTSDESQDLPTQHALPADTSLSRSAAETVASSVQSPVPMNRTSTLNTRPVPLPRKRCSKPEDQVESETPPKSLEAHENITDSLARVPPKLPPRPDRRKSGVNSGSEIPTGYFDSNPVVPPRTDMTEDVDDERPVPPPRKTRS